MKPVDNQLKEIIKGAIVEVQAGIGGEVKKPNQLKPEVAKVVMERIGDEYTAHYFYRNATNWCRNVGYMKAAAFFENEANDELTHAKMVQDYLVDFNIDVVIPPAKTDATFATLIDIVGQAYDMEYGLFNKYNNISSAIFTVDLATFDFLQQLREIQRSAVIEYSDLLNAAQLINVNNKLDVLLYERKYFKQ